MLPKANNLFAQSRTARTMVRLFTIALFIGFFAMSQASVKAVTVWSDAWLNCPPQQPDQIAPNTDGVLVVGCGVTEATYDDDWELQSVKVTTTLRSPNGRTATLSDHTWSNRATYSAIAEPRLSFDPNDLGNFTISSHHYSTCPPTELGFTRIPFNLSLAAESYTGLVLPPVAPPNTCYYSRPVPGCVGLCVNPNGTFYGPVYFESGSVCQEYIQAYSIVVDFRCVFNFGFGTSVPGECY